MWVLGGRVQDKGVGDRREDVRQGHREKGKGGEKGEKNGEERETNSAKLWSSWVLGLTLAFSFNYTK